MNKVAIMTDTISGIPPEMAEEFGIKVIPLYIIMDGISYVETEVNRDQLYARLAKKESLPTTSSPTAAQYLEAYRELSQKTEAILHIHYTSWIGMGYKEALRAKKMAKEELPQTTIEVIDSRAECGAQLLCVLEAARAARDGKTLPQVVAVVNDLIPRLNLFYILDTLYYLRRGGRVGKAAAWVNSALAVKSILELDAGTKGVATPVTRTRTKDEAIRKLVGIVKERNQNRMVHAVVSHGNASEQAEKLKRQLLSQVSVKEIHITGVSPIHTVHWTPGALRLGWYSEG
jgi:DegV family protein with EDD domain